MLALRSPKPIKEADYVDEKVITGISGHRHERVVLRVLRNDPKLTELDLGGADVGTEVAGWLGDALRRNTHLAALYLNGNHLGDRGVAALAEGLAANGTLSELYLFGNQITDEGAAALARLLHFPDEEGEQDDDGLGGGGLGGGGLGGGGGGGGAAASLSRKTSAASGRSAAGSAAGGGSVAGGRASVAAASSRKSSAGAGAAGAMIVGGAGRFGAAHADSALGKLDLRNNDIGNAGATALAAALRENVTLVDLDLRFNRRIGDGGYCQLAGALQGNLSLLALAVDTNRLTQRINRKLEANRRWLVSKAERVVELEVLLADGDIDKAEWLEQMDIVRKGGKLTLGQVKAEVEEDKPTVGDQVEEKVDKHSGRVYYENMRTKETSWYREDVEAQDVMVVRADY